MKKLTILSMVLALVLSVVPAMAESGKAPAGFQALGKLSTTLTPMTDEQLAAVEGEQICTVISCINLVVVVQANTCAACGLNVLTGGNATATATQSNRARIRNRIN